MQHIIHDLICTFCYAAHRALADIQALEELLMSTQLLGLVASLPKRSATQQLQLGRLQKHQRTRTTTLLHSLGNRITAAQAKRLDALQLSYTALCTVRENTAGDTEFQRILLECGVRSKLLREKLTAVLPKYR